MTDVNTRDPECVPGSEYYPLCLSTTRDFSALEKEERMNRMRMEQTPEPNTLASREPYNPDDWSTLRDEIN